MVLKEPGAGADAESSVLNKDAVGVKQPFAVTSQVRDGLLSAHEYSCFLFL